jgi:hypothetical protein
MLCRHRLLLALCGFDQLLEPGGIPDGHIREDFPIQLDPCLLQRVDKSRIEHPVAAACRSNARDPEPAEISFTIPTIAVGILLRLVHRLGRSAKELALRAVIAFRQFESLLMT